MKALIGFKAFYFFRSVSVRFRFGFGVYVKWPLDLKMFMKQSKNVKWPILCLGKYGTCKIGFYMILNVKCECIPE